MEEVQQIRALFAHEIAQLEANYEPSSMISWLENLRDKVVEVADAAHAEEDELREGIESAVWAVLEERLEDVIDLDLNDPRDGELMRGLVRQVVQAVLKADFNSMDLTRWSSRHLRSLADECKRIIQGRAEDGVTS